ncbi:MAG TPA: efflux RND transporter periplasmic adaptor subunit [Rhabdaerophilum sp.]|nr:efflux RND transporter periplasmic adaptor subunit [Rhabdaerophilum sp.]
MRVSTQLGLIAVVGAGLYFGWSRWADVAPVIAKVPGLAFLAPAKNAQPSAGGQQRGQQGQAMLVEVATLGVGSITERSDAVGTLRAYESVTLTAKVSGTVEKIAFGEGQFVKAGDELVRLDVSEKRADLEAARAAIATTRAQHAETWQKLERAQALRKTGAGTEAQVADLTLQLRTIETNIAAAEARERAAAARLDDLILRAPFDGRVGLRQVSLGALVDNKVAVTTLDDISRMRLDFSVPESLVGRVSVGAKVDATSIAFSGRVFEGEIAVIDTRIDPVTRSAKVTALVPNKEAILKPGMFMNVSIEVAVRDNVILAPEEAIVAEGPRQIAFIVKDGKIDRRVVRIGQRQKGNVEIQSGVEPGEVIVVRGVQRVRQGIPVRTKPAFPVPGGPAADGKPAQAGQKAG